MVRAGQTLAMLLALAVLGSFLGRLHPLGDSLAVFRLPLAVMACLVFVIVPMPKQVKLIGLGAFAASIIGICLQLLPIGGNSYDFRSLYQKNLLFKNGQVQLVADDILSTGAEIVTLQEVSDINQTILTVLRPDYPTQVFCPFTSWSGIAVLSRFPAADEDPVCSQGRGLAAIKLIGPDGPFWAISIHLHWPWPYGQRPQLEHLLPILDSFDAPIVIGGDFNMVPWSSAVRRSQRASNTMIVSGDGPTLTIRHVPLLIDHVLAPGGGWSQRRPILGGDHHGVFAHISLKPNP